MKCLFKLAFTSVLLLPVTSFANWQVAKPAAGIPSQPFFQAGEVNTPDAVPAANTAFPDQFGNLGKPASVYAISVSGSLKENVERIMDRYHWKVIWNVPYDYNFDGRVTGSSLPNVIEKLLSPFPLQATLFMSNRTMTVMPRKI